MSAKFIIFVLASTVATIAATTTTTPVPSSSTTPAQPCNETVFASCLSIGLNSTVPANLICLVGGSQCSTVPPISQCNANISSTGSTQYGLMCTTSGLNLYPVSANSCITILQTTASLCQSGILQKQNVTCTGNFSGNVVLTSAEAKSISTTLARTCVTTPRPTTPLPLLPNPVGPEAITAIVVLVCLFITVILAGFFFWPKCHIANPAAEAVKRATKPASAKTAAAGNGNKPTKPTTAAGFSASGGTMAAGGGRSAQPGYNVQYDGGDRNAATVKMSSPPGPSAA